MIDLRRTIIGLLTIALISNLPHCLFMTPIGIPPLTYVACISQLFMLTPALIWHRQFERLFKRPFFPAFVAMCVALGVLTLWVLPSIKSLAYASAAMISVGEVIFWLYEGLVLSRMNGLELRIAAFGGMEFSFFLAVTVLSLPSWASTAVQVLLVLLIGLVLTTLYAKPHAIDAKPTPLMPGPGSQRPSSLPLELACMISLFSLGMNYLRTGVGTSGDWVSTFAFAAIIAGGIIIVEFALFSKGLFSILDTAVVLMLAVPILFLGAGIDHGPVLLSLASIGFFMITPRYYQWIVSLAQEEESSPFRGIATMYLLNAIFQIAGALIFSTSSQLLEPFERFTVAILISVGIILCAFIPFRSRARDRLIHILGMDNNDFMDIKGHDEQQLSLDCKGEKKATGIEMLRNLELCCAEISRDYLLTKREAEVLLLLARRKTIASMAHELCLSANTIKSHVLHVHQKLDVHSHEELFSLIESYDRNEKSNLH